MLKIWDDESYGMERNMNRSTSEVMRNSRPIKMDENMRNIKVEGDNSFSFVSTFKRSFFAFLNIEQARA